MPANCNVKKGNTMKNASLKLAVLSALGFASMQVFAAGSLCALPAAPTGSAYINAYNDGRVIPPLAGPPTTTVLARSNFGILSTSGAVANCSITALVNDSSPPLPGYTLVVSASRTVPTTTGGTGNIGTITDRIWRNASNTMCVFGARFTAINADHDGSLSGTQYFEVNDIARGGFSSSGTVNVGYFLQAANAYPVFRIGRTFTSVQHRPYIYGSGTLAQQQNNGTGYLDLPTIGGTGLSINGLNSPLPPSTIAPSVTVAQQEALIDTNWVDFTTKVTFLNEDGSFNPVSSFTYVEAPCNGDSVATINSTWVKPRAFSLRQTAQRNTTFKTIDVHGYAPPGAVIP